MPIRLNQILRAVPTARPSFRDESGATAIEYGLVAGLLSIVIFSAAGAVGAHLATTFAIVASKFP